MQSAFVTGLAGLELAPHEAALLRAARPCGIILFKRNILEPEQVRRLIGAARTAVGAQDFLVLIDQEGGRVQRLTPPHWRDRPAAAQYGAAWARDPAGAVRAARFAAQLAALDLVALGINTSCAPVLDLAVPGGHTVIGDRAYGATPDRVVALGRAVAEGLLAGGVLPVIKHIPGHGRATKDSHLELPTVAASRADLEAADFVPFRALADLPAAMTAHVVFPAVDPAAPASISARLTREVIRGSIGFDGLLMSDDLGMAALSGSMPQRAQAVLRAGSDVALLCNGDFAEMEAVAAIVPPLAGRSQARFERACAAIGPQQALDVATAEACLAEVLRADA
ncbi:MAG TPA: beta-N-acetylhexosaminidase [Hyphomicrobiaceae bacterium]|nr:beta-N-acetylhexosaminidase [Hyphomicrobiaceae bacterium]